MPAGDEVEVGGEKFEKMSPEEPSARADAAHVRQGAYPSALPDSLPGPRP